jgi:membrane fusion protein (multidrug efflux system)
VVVVGEGDKVETRKVTPGQKVGALWIIQEGLRNGDRVVIEGFQRLRDGMTIVPKQAAAPAPAANPAPAGGK